MGGQNTCCMNRLMIEEGELRPMEDANQFVFIPGQPYHLAAQTDRIYKSLLQQYNNNEYLSIKINQESTQDTKQLPDYYKLEKYDAYYSGEWKDNAPHGRGKVIFPDGSILIGTFKNNYCFGSECYLIFKDGSYYKGNISENLLSGKGKLISKTVEYDGNWQRNLPQGEGIEKFINGDRYIGTFEQGLKEGIDSLFIWGSHPMYKQYRGNFKAGRISGQGVLTLKKEEAVIEGIFQQNEINKAVLNCTRCKFEGNFSKGRINGKGKIVIHDLMETFDGNFNDGQLSGKCIVTDSKNRQSETYFFKGRQLRKMKNFRDQQIQKIINIIEKCYENVRKHSEALIELNQQLVGKYECKFIEPFESIFTQQKYLIVDIFEKMLMIQPVEQP